MRSLSALVAHQAREERDREICETELSSFQVLLTIISDCALVVLDTTETLRLSHWWMDIEANIDL